MAVELHEDSDGKVLIVNLSGKLVREDYIRLNPHVEQLVRAQGKVRMVVRMHDFHGWTMGALWEDIKFDLRHFAHIERLALIGDKKWEAGMAMFCKPFTTARIRFFDESRADEALAWVREGIQQPAATG